MATNSFDALIQDVNERISQMGAATSSANGGAAMAKEAAENAAAQAEAAQTAAQDAQDAAGKANALAGVWEGATVDATTLAAGSAATVNVTETEGAKKIVFGIPRGATGAQGPKGDTGKSGVTFRLTGTSLYITTG